MGKKRNDKSGGVAAEVMQMFSFGRDQPTSTDELARQQRSEALSWRTGGTVAEVKNVRTRSTEMPRVTEQQRDGDPPMTYEEKEEHYARARARIFGGGGGIPQLQRHLRYSAGEEEEGGERQAQHRPHRHEAQEREEEAPHHQHPQHYPEVTPATLESQTVVIEGCSIPPMPDARLEVIPVTTAPQARTLWQPAAAAASPPPLPASPVAALPTPDMPEKSRMTTVTSSPVAASRYDTPPRSGRGSRGACKGRGGSKGSGSGRGGGGGGGSRGAPRKGGGESRARALLRGHIDPEEREEYARDSIKFEGYVKPSLKLLSHYD